MAFFETFRPIVLGLVRSVWHISMGGKGLIEWLVYFEQLHFLDQSLATLTSFHPGLGGGGT